ncbi:MAG: carbohydrate ABC transporter permease [Candidatus Aureabacteria bacterium]|nr:carbohydrate ABC transporter permease [Candidatus Auribacterota bacterium]
MVKQKAKAKFVSSLKEMGLLKRFFYYGMLSFIGITMLLPFFWMVSTSLKDEGEVFSFPPTWIPSETNYFTSYDKALVDSVIEYRKDKNIAEGLEDIQALAAKAPDSAEMALNIKIIKRISAVKILSGEYEGREVDIDSSLVSNYVPNWLTPWKKKPAVSAGEIMKSLGLIERGDRIPAGLNVKVPCEVLKVKLFVKITDEETPLLDEKCWIPAGKLKEEWKPVFRWDNYPKAWKALPFGRAYINSIIVALCVTFGQAFTSSMAAYAFARLHFPGRDKIFLLYLATMMIPGAVTMIPVFIIMKLAPDMLNLVSAKIGTFFYQLFGGSPDVQILTEFWDSKFEILGHYIGRPIGLDSYFALIVPGLCSAYGTFMLRQFFMSIPVDLEDAAKIDGCSLFGIYIRIILPLSKPALATLVTFTFMAVWRDFMWPLIVCSSDQMKTLPVLLASFQGVYNTQYTLLMAASLIVLMPVILVFLFNQRFFIEGIQLGAIKG